MVTIQLMVLSLGRLATLDLGLVLAQARQDLSIEIQDYSNILITLFFFFSLDEIKALT